MSSRMSVAAGTSDATAGRAAAVVGAGEHSRPTRSQPEPEPATPAAAATVATAATITAARWDRAIGRESRRRAAKASKVGDIGADRRGALNPCQSRSNGGQTAPPGSRSSHPDPSGTRTRPPSPSFPHAATDNSGMSTANLPGAAGLTQALAPALARRTRSRTWSRIEGWFRRTTTAGGPAASRRRFGASEARGDAGPSDVGAAIEPPDSTAGLPVPEISRAAAERFRPAPKFRGAAAGSVRTPASRTARASWPG